jgi:hypothetical protein
MVDNFRLFILSGPKMCLTVAIDIELVADPKLKKQPGADTAKPNEVAAGLTARSTPLLAIKPGPTGRHQGSGQDRPRRGEARPYVAEVPAQGQVTPGGRFTGEPPASCQSTAQRA